MTLEEMNSRFMNIRRELNSLLEDTGYLDEGRVYNVAYDREDLEEELNINVANTLLRLAKPIVDRLNYLTLSVKAFGDLEFDDYSLKYHLGDNYLSSGDIVEVLLPIEDDLTGDKRTVWRIVTVEYDPHREDYFFRGGGAENMPLIQATIRLR